ncbi:hypothetical protein [Amycolatopsis australiensis]|uniref:4-amino-4-deoxy-L-arabinose transferase n=1 Tax=Amycolatopsis australiensis TaxID=546364 RepID=A0A1K1P6X2_9PSEU|nr:hypothetical protein [Amycolatopsis australiensis]SFW42430.1 hypothetical protein SAMN04489730_0226 [Amycolatopsis australiensis]
MKDLVEDRAPAAVPESDPAAGEAAGSTRSRRLGERFRAWRLLVGAPSRATLLISGLLTILTWEMPAFSPIEPKGDYDYGLAIAMARHLGLSFGDRIATTYGPLYFLAIPSTTVRAEVAIGFLFWFVFVTGCLAACFQAFQSRIGTRWAWVACAAIAVSFSIVPLTSVITATPGFVAVLAICHALGLLPKWAERAFPVVMGLTVAAMLLTKFSVGLMCGPIVLGAVLVRPGRRLREFAEYAVSGVAGLFVFWVAVGQPPAQVVQYVVRAISVGSGHAQSMGLEPTANAWEYVVAAAATIVLAVCVARVKVDGWRWPLWLGLLAGVWLLFKQGFVRHDSHSAQYFAVVFALAVLLAVLRRSAVLAVVAAVSLVAQAVSFGGGLWTIDPGRSLRTFAEGATIVASGSHRDDIQEEARAELRKRTDVPQRFLTRIGRESLRTEPFDQAIAWTYGLTPAILPTLLNYGAYTELLDKMNEAWIADDVNGPRFIIRENTRTTLDGRFALWDPPRTELAETCRYHLVDSTDHWLLLERGPNRCGAERELSSVQVAAGQAVPVPKADHGVVVARVYPEQSPLERVWAFLFKPGVLDISLDGEAFRLPWTHQDAPLMVAAPQEESVALSGRPLAAGTLSMSAPGRVVFSVVDRP